VGLNSSEDARHCSVLYIYKYFVNLPICWRCCETIDCKSTNSTQNLEGSLIGNLSSLQNFLKINFRNSLRTETWNKLSFRINKMGGNRSVRYILYLWEKGKGGGSQLQWRKKASLLVLVRSAEVSSWDLANSICFWKLVGIQNHIRQKSVCGRGELKFKFKKGSSRP
jgi:hypothetical protein